MQWHIEFFFIISGLYFYPLSNLYTYSTSRWFPHVNGSASVKWEVFRAVKDQSLTALTALNAFRRPSHFTDVCYDTVLLRRSFGYLISKCLRGHFSRSKARYRLHAMARDGPGIAHIHGISASLNVRPQGDRVILAHETMAQFCNSRPRIALLSTPICSQKRGT
jgi:hypothetical protein